MTDEVDDVVRKVKARLETIELAIQGLKYELEMLDRPKRWNPCQLDPQNPDWP